MKFWPYVFLKFYKIYMVLKQSVVFPDEFDHEKFIFSLLEVGEFAAHTQISKRLYDVTSRTEGSRKSFLTWHLTRKDVNLVVAEEENIV